MARSFKKNYVLADPASESAWQLLCSWDFNITNERAVRQHKSNLRVQLKVTVFVFQTKCCHLRQQIKTYSMAGIYNIINSLIKTPKSTF